MLFLTRRANVLPFVYWNSAVWSHYRDPEDEPARWSVDVTVAPDSSLLAGLSACGKRGDPEPPVHEPAEHVGDTVAYHHTAERLGCRLHAGCRARSTHREWRNG